MGVFRFNLVAAGLVVLSGPSLAQVTAAPTVGARLSGASAKGVIVLPAQPAVAVATAAPAPVPGATSAMFKPCARPFASSAATLGSGSGFDRAVTAALKRRPDSAVVDIATPFSVAGDPPGALTPWLNQVKASGGIVSASEYCRDTRGMFGWIGRMFRAAKGVSYKAADGYDAVLHVDGLDQTVTQVEFRRRGS